MLWVFFSLFCRHVIGVDMDSDALEIASSNATDLEVGHDIPKKMSFSYSCVNFK